jgi:hypothetical protein
MNGMIEHSDCATNTDAIQNTAGPASRRIPIALITVVPVHPALRQDQKGKPFGIPGNAASLAASFAPCVAVQRWQRVCSRD